MRKITFYILRQLTIGMIFIAVGLTCILWLSQSLRFVELIVEKGLSTGIFITLTILLMPSFLVIVFPVALFSSIMLIYNKLQSDRELVVMSTSGVSPWALTKPALILGCMVCACCYVLTLALIPNSYREFRHMEYAVRNNMSGLLVQEGAFTTVVSGLTVYARARDMEGTLLEIMVYDNRNPAEPATMMAEKGIVISDSTMPPEDGQTSQDGNGIQILMLNGNRQSVAPGGKFSILYFDSYIVEIADENVPEEERFRDARERSLRELVSASKATVGEAEFRRFRTEAHQRFISPLYNISFTFVALACLLSGSFSRRGQMGRVLTGVVIMVLMQVAALGASNLAVKDLVFIPLMYFSPIMPGVVAAWILFKGMLFRPRFSDDAERNMAGKAG